MGRGFILRKIVSMFLLLLLATSCAQKATSEKCPYDLYALADDRSFNLERGHYECKERSGFGYRVETTDVAGPVQIAEQLDPINLQKNTKLTFKTEGTPKYKILLWHSNDSFEEVPLEDDNSFILPGDKGEYIFEIISEEKLSTVHYVLLVDINDDDY